MLSLSPGNNTYEWRNAYMYENYALEIMEMLSKKSAIVFFFSKGVRSIVCGLWQSTKYIYLIWTYILLQLLDSVLRKCLETHETDLELFSAHKDNFELAVSLEINITTWELHSCFPSVLNTGGGIHSNNIWNYLLIHSLQDLETKYIIETTVRRKKQEYKYKEGFT